MSNQDAVRQMRVIVVDSDASTVALLERILVWARFERFEGFTDSFSALASIQKEAPDLLILDNSLRSEDDFELLRALRSIGKEEFAIPILIFSSNPTSEERIEALALGATDFLSKPVDASELMLRVHNSLEVRYLHQELRKQNRNLEEMVSARTKELVIARLDALDRLALTAEFRDDDSGEHARRVGELSYRIALHLGDPDADPELIKLAAPLHDIGKVAIPDTVLLKPAKLTTTELDVMRTHTLVGAEILGGSQVEVLSAAATIALTHHEKWNGTGYPKRLRGEEIPLTGRIVAVADVYDALTHRRTYKEAWTKKEAVSYIVKKAGQDFDPRVVKAFQALVDGLAQAA